MFTTNAKNNFEYRMCTIITPGLNTFYPLFEFQLFTVSFGMCGWYSRAVSNQERVIVVLVQCLKFI